MANFPKIFKNQQFPVFVTWTTGKNKNLVSIITFRIFATENINEKEQIIEIVK